ncbi:MAG: deoxyribodipyrimidine photo-lyase [Desulfobacteraceae bacterium]|jgi:deoxyribodipyrimidine photo-lyase|nr:deoxyribodipyrimidine photo-lyase [Desulfobacteraceae bacterium]
MTHPIEPERIKGLNGNAPQKGKFVLYWMQQSQREHWNHALEYAIITANETKKPVVVVFGLTTRYPEANLRHYSFMLQGLFDTMQALKSRGIRMIILGDDPDRTALEAGSHASEIICDRGYTRIQKHWREIVAKESACRLTQVESDVVVPIETVSEKAEYAARTIRPKIHKNLSRFLVPVKKVILKNQSLSFDISRLNLNNILADNSRPTDDNQQALILGNLDLDDSISPVTRFFHGGFSHAKKRFDAFLKNSIQNYSQHSNQPQTDDTSCMSPYLHFGHISPVYLALRIQNEKTPDTEIHQAAKDDFQEQLIVRRELAVNFIHFTPNYDTYDCLPDWAKKTLNEHEKDRRPVIYSIKELEQAQTRDPYWNAAMEEMKTTGFMHNYMRMYWGKKILEWSSSPHSAFETTLLLNNKYFLDGRDANSFAGVAWIFGKHDRAWKERDIFGKVRYMNAAGLERKCDINGYVRKVGQLTQI